MALSATPAVAIEFDAGVWTDVSALTRQAQTFRGRSTEADRYSAGRATVVLANADRRFDPEHTAGTYYGKLLPRKRIRVGFTYAATTYWKFYGYIDGWPQSYDGPRDSTVTVRATDAFKVFARAQVPSAWEQEVKADTPAVWYRLGESSGTQAADSSGNGRHGLYEGGATFNSRAGLVANDSDGSIGFDGVDDELVGPAETLSAPLTIEWMSDSVLPAVPAIRFERSTGTGTPLITFAVDTSTGILTASFLQGLGERYASTAVSIIGKHVAVVYDAGASGATPVIYVNGVDQTVPILGFGTAPTSFQGRWRLGLGGVGSENTFDEFATYTSALSAARALVHYNAGNAPWDGDTPKARMDRVLDYIGWSAGDRDLDTGSALLVPAQLESDALSHLQDVEVTEGGRFFINRTGAATLIGRANQSSETVYNTSNATFGDSGSELKYTLRRGELFGFDDDKIVNEARVRQHGGSEQIAADATSKTAYGLMSRSESSLEQRAAVVKNRAEYLVSRYKDPTIRMPQVTIKPERSPATLYAILGANDLGYRYTFVRRPQGVGSAISKQFHVESESLTMTPDDITFEWELSPAEIVYAYVDVATVDGALVGY